MGAARVTLFANLDTLWKAAVKRDTAAQLSLAERYIAGTGGTPNLPEGYRWLVLAAGSPIIGREDLPDTKPANDRRDVLVNRRIALEAQMSPVALAEAKRLTLRGYPLGRFSQR